MSRGQCVELLRKPVASGCIPVCLYRPSAWDSFVHHTRARVRVRVRVRVRACVAC